MSKFLILHASLSVAVAIGVIPALAAAAPAKTGGVKLSAALSGANEVNAEGVGEQGDPDGTGTFSGHLVRGKGQLCYTLTWSGIDAPTMAHIHTGPAGKNGPVFVPLPDITPGENCMSVDGAKATALLAKPENFYVNVHNPAFPAGAVRGQLAKGPGAAGGTTTGATDTTRTRGKAAPGVTSGMSGPGNATTRTTSGSGMGTGGSGTGTGGTSTGGTGGTTPR